MLAQIFYLSINLTLVGTIAALVVILLRAVFKNRVKKSVFVFLWLIVFLRLVIPVSIPSPTSVFNLFNNNMGSVTDGIDIAPSFVKENMHNKIPAVKKEASAGIAMTQKSNSSTIGKNTPQDVKDAINPVDIAAFIWLAVTAILMVFSAAIYLRTIKSVKDADAFDCAVLSDCRQALRMKKHVKLLQSGSVSSPFVLGIINPKIILPQSAATTSDISLTHILTHEMIHIKRFDNIKKIVSCFVLCIHWYNPLVWLCYILLQRDLEAACDEKVLKVLGSHIKKEYATSLYEFASQKHSLSGVGFTFFGETGTKGRVINILQYKKTSAAAFVTACCLVTSVVAACATNPVVSASGNKLFHTGKAAYVTNDGLYCANTSDGKTTLLLKGKGISSPVFSNNGNAIAFKMGDDLYAYNFSESKTQMLLASVDSFCPAPKDEFYASSQKRGIILLNPKTAKSSVIVSPQKDTTYTDLKQSPDLKKLAYTSTSGTNTYGNDGTWLYDTISKKQI